MPSLPAPDRPAAAPTANKKTLKPARGLRVVLLFVLEGSPQARSSPPIIITTMTPFASPMRIFSGLRAKLDIYWNPLSLSFTATADAKPFHLTTEAASPDQRLCR